MLVMHTVFYRCIPLGIELLLLHDAALNITNDSDTF